MVVHFAAKMPRKCIFFVWTLKVVLLPQFFVISSHGHTGRMLAGKLKKGRRGSLTDAGSTKQVLECVIVTNKRLIVCIHQLSESKVPTGQNCFIFLPQISFSSGCQLQLLLLISAP
jgi:hypothetical protein